MRNTSKERLIATSVLIAFEDGSCLCASRAERRSRMSQKTWIKLARSTKVSRFRSMCASEHRKTPAVPPPLR